MSFSGGSSDSEWKATKVKTEKIIKSDKKYYQQKFVERWLDRFKPWLARDVNDRQKPFCKACKCTLNCNKCHLQRHERTTKHRSNLRDYLHASGLIPSKQNKGQRKDRKERTRLKLGLPETEGDESKFESVFMNVEFEGKKEQMDEPVAQETLHDFQFVQTENEVDVQPSRDSNMLDTKIVKRLDVSSPKVASLKKDRQKLLLQIQKDKDELMSSFNELFTTAVIEKKEKNHVDLFFDSVSSSVKALSPKLIAEAKMRVSQLICELELRAITENENACRDSASSTMLLAPISNTYIIDHHQTGNGSNQVGSSQKDASYGATD